jgi:hypothetical protein
VGPQAPRKAEAVLSQREAPDGHSSHGHPHVSHQSQCVSSPVRTSLEVTHHPPWLHPRPGSGL